MSDKNDKSTNSIYPVPEKLDQGIKELGFGIKIIVIVGIIIAVIATVLLLTSGTIKVVPMEKIRESTGLLPLG